jgi:hypothetical protein
VQFARATRPDTLTAITVNVHDAETRMLSHDWERRSVHIPLIVVESPYRVPRRGILRSGTPRLLVGRALRAVVQRCPGLCPWFAFFLRRPRFLPGRLDIVVRSLSRCISAYAA